MVTSIAVLLPLLVVIRFYLFDLYRNFNSKISIKSSILDVALVILGDFYTLAILLLKKSDKSFTFYL